MKKMINIRNGIIIVLCLTIIFMGIGFIVLSVELKNTKDEVHSFDVSFSRIEKSSSVKGSSVEPSSSAEIISGGSELSMIFDLSAFHDEITYVATIENKWTLPAEIVDLMQSPDFSVPTFKNIIAPVTISVTDLKGKIIPPGDEMSLKIVVYYNPSSTPATRKNINYRLGLITKSR